MKEGGIGIARKTFCLKFHLQYRHQLHTVVAYVTFGHSMGILVPLRYTLLYVADLATAAFSELIYMSRRTVCLVLGCMS